MNKFKLRSLYEGMESTPVKASNEGDLPKPRGSGGDGGIGVY